MTGTHSYTCSARLLQCKLQSEGGGWGGGGLLLSKIVYVWQNAHISKNRKEAEKKTTIKNLGSILWHLKLKYIIWVSQGQSTWLVVFQGNWFFGSCH